MLKRLSLVLGAACAALALAACQTPGGTAPKIDNQTLYLAAQTAIATANTSVSVLVAKGKLPPATATKLVDAIKTAQAALDAAHTAGASAPDDQSFPMAAAKILAAMNAIQTQLISAATATPS